MTTSYKKSKAKATPHYLRLLVDLHEGNIAEAARAIGLTGSTVSSNLKSNVCSQVIELAARGVVDRATAQAPEKVLEVPNPRVALRNYYRGKEIKDLTMDDLNLMGMTIIEILKTPGA